MNFSRLLSDGSPSTLSRAFWLAPTDPRPLAATRIGLGIILLGQCLDLFPFAAELYGRDGLTPKSPLDLTNPTLFEWLNGPVAVRVVLVVHAVALVAYAAGFFTRSANVIAWAINVSMHHRMGGICTGGDWLADVLLFISLFAPVSAVWSIDALRRGSIRTQVEPYALRTLQLLMALLYWSTARLKHKGSWGDGEGIRLSLEMVAFNRPLGAFLHAHPELCRVTTYFILALEYLFPLLVLSPIRTRTCQLLGAAVGLAIQFGILLTMRVGPFTLIMLLTTVLFIPSELWDRVVPLDPTRPISAPPSRRYVALTTLPIALVALLNTHSILLGSRIPRPRAVANLESALGLALNPGLFHMYYEVSWYEALVTDVAGTTRDVIPEQTPGLEEPRVGWLFKPWTKASFGLHGLPRPHVAAFFCAQGRALESLQEPQALRLIRHHYVQAPDVYVPTFQRDVLWDDRCPDSSAQ